MTHDPSSRTPGAPQPWHEADEKPRERKRGPIGTHSFAGGRLEVGLPAAPRGEAERGAASDAPATADELAEPRAIAPLPPR